MTRIILVITSVEYLQAPQMVFFKEAVEHILRAARVFRQPGGHMLLVSKLFTLELKQRI